MTIALEDRYDDRIVGVLSCYDRVVITGTLPTVCYAGGMTGFLSAIEVHIFRLSGIRGDAARAGVRERVATVAAEAGVAIGDHIAQSHIRKEEIVANVLNQRGDHPGLWCISSQRDGGLPILSALA